MFRVGLISDTHNHLSEEVASIFQGVDHIIHAGDVGQPRILMELEKVAPTTAVSGNTDHGLACRETEELELGGLRFLVHHIVDPHAPGGEMERRIRRAKTNVVVFGHTHRAFHERIRDVLFVNPGSASRPRMSGGCSVAILKTAPSGPEVDFHAVRP